LRRIVLNRLVGPVNYGHGSLSSRRVARNGGVPGSNPGSGLGRPEFARGPVRSDLLGFGGADDSPRPSRAGVLRGRGL
jgi:hypothetical protein